MLNSDPSLLLAISVCVALMIQGIKMLLNVNDNYPMYRRLQPLIASLLGAVIAAYAIKSYEIEVRLMWGFIAGGFSSGGYSIINGLVEAWKSAIKKRAPELPLLPAADEAPTTSLPAAQDVQHDEEQEP